MNKKLVAYVVITVDNGDLEDYSSDIYLSNHGYDSLDNCDLSVKYYHSHTLKDKDDNLLDVGLSISILFEIKNMQELGYEVIFM